MHIRNHLFVLIFIILVSLKIYQPAFAESNCDLTMHYNFPPTNWISITADKESPANPVVKQELEELAARGELAQAPNYYDTKFKATVALKPGTATWNTLDTITEWEWDCSPYMESLGLCKAKGHWQDVQVCNAHGPVPAYRSIKTMKFFLIPSTQTQQWYADTVTEPSPTMLFAYPDFWMPVTVSGGFPSADRWLEQGGLHFYLSQPLRGGDFFLPSKLPQISRFEAVINAEDAYKFPDKIFMAVPVCDADAGGDLEHGFTSINMVNYGYTKPYWEDMLIGNDSYTCTPSANILDNTVQSIELNIKDYDFDVPGTFYIGIATQILPAISPKGDGSTELITYPAYFQPSNISLDKGDPNYYLDTQFSVWMIASTPCWNGNMGNVASGPNNCNLLNNPH